MLQRKAAPVNLKLFPEFIFYPGQPNGGLSNPRSGVVDEDIYCDSGIF
ncbi:MAG: hypothetical protein HQ477_09430 [Chloroflexi bacterium]|nr:hypothetical protein [Chloroflexota bacterium]